MDYRVRLEKAVRRRLRRVPRYVVDKLEARIELVETDGLEEAKRILGFHDEPLKGKTDRPAIHSSKPSMARHLRVAAGW